jgi:hypothetical protein
MWTWIACFGGVPFLGGVVGTSYGLNPFDGATRVNYVVFGLSCASMAVGVLLGIRSALVAVVATRDALIIRNFWSTTRIPWAEIRAVQRPLPWLGRFFWSDGLYIGLRDGSTKIATAYKAAGGDPADFADAVIADLRRRANLARRPARCMPVRRRRLRRL